MVKSSKEKTKSYTKGELNKLIDSLCHPFFKSDKGFILFDGLLHGLVEQDPPTSVRKFIKYNLPQLIKRARGKTRLFQMITHSKITRMCARFMYMWFFQNIFSSS